MKPYKKLFSESINDEVNSQIEAETEVNISGLQWGKAQGRSCSWNEAIEKCPIGWRLPTIQELYTAFWNKVNDEEFLKNDPGHSELGYWSSTRYGKHSMKCWYFTFLDYERLRQIPNVDYESNNKFVCYVRDI